MSASQASPTRSVVVATLLLPLLAVGLLAQRVDPERVAIDVQGILQRLPRSELSVVPYGSLVFSLSESRFGSSPDLPDLSVGSVVLPVLPAHLSSHGFMPIHGEAILSLVKEGCGLAMADLKLSGGSILLSRELAGERPRIEEFLSQLQRQVSTEYAIECVIIEDEVFRSLCEGAGEPSAADLFEQALRLPDSYFVSLIARSGQPRSSGCARVRAILEDYEIHQLGVLPVVQPTLAALADGTRIELCPHEIPGVDELLVDVVIRVADTSDRRRPLGSDWSDLDLPAIHERMLSTSIRLRPGHPAILGSGRGSEPFAVLLQVRRLANSPQLSAAVADLFGRYDLSCWKRRLDLRQWPAVEMPRRSTAKETVSFGFADDKARSTGADDGLPSEALHFEITTCVGSRELLPRIRELSDERLLLAPDWKERLLRAGDDAPLVDRFTIRGAASAVVALRTARVEAFVGDVETISGGSIDVIEEPDPIVDTCGTGTEIWLEAAVDRRTGNIRLHTAGVQSLVKGWRSTDVRLPIRETATRPVSDGKGLPRARHRSVKSISISRPEQLVRSWNLLRTFPPGRTALLRQEVDAEGRVFLLLGRVDRED